MSEKNMNSGNVQDDVNAPLKGAFVEFGKENIWDTISWYMVVFSFILLALAGLCFYLKVIPYPDFHLNGRVLGNYLLSIALTLYVGGRAIKYYRRYKKKESG